MRNEDRVVFFTGTSLHWISSFNQGAEMCNLLFLRLMINQDYPGIHPDRIK